MRRVIQTTVAGVPRVSCEGIRVTGQTDELRANRFQDLRLYQGSPRQVRTRQKARKQGHRLALAARIDQLMPRHGTAVESWSCPPMRPERSHCPGI